MPHFAQIQLAGHLGEDSKLSFTGSGTAVLRFNLAVNTGYGDNKTTSWYRCTMFGKQGESLQQYCLKGTAVIVGGEPSIREFTAESGKKYTNVEVNVKTFSFAGKERQDNPGKEPSQGNVVESSQDDLVPF